MPCAFIKLAKIALGLAFAQSQEVLYEEGRIINADYVRRARRYSSEGEVRAACSHDDGCKGYWQRSSGEYYVLSSGTRTWAMGEPNDIVISVKVKQHTEECDETACSLTSPHGLVTRVAEIAAGVQAWEDRAYVLIGPIPSEMSGARFLRLARHRSGYQGLQLSFSGMAGSTLFVCFHPVRDCGYAGSLPNAGFRTSASLTFNDPGAHPPLICYKQSVVSSDILLPRITTAECTQVVAVKCAQPLCGNGGAYRGCQTVTISGKTCQNWAAQSPHIHGFTPLRYLDAGLGNHNCCRDPDASNRTWCHTTDAATLWEYCDPARRVLVEFGSFDGGWLRAKMTEPGKHFDRCFVFEADRHAWDRVAAVAAMCGCTFFPKAIWDRSGYANFFGEHPGRLSGGQSLYGRGIYSHRNETPVETVDVASFFSEYLRPSDNLMVRMDIEGAEYRVMRRLLTTGLACWISTLSLEVHALYNKVNFNKLPLDMAIVWLLQGCEPPVEIEELECYYEEDPKVKQYWQRQAPADARPCKQCSLLRHPIPDM